MVDRLSTVINTEPDPRLQAFGEMLGMDVPTRYPEETHNFLNQVMAADCMVTPVLLRMSGPTVWLCRALAALLAMTSMRGERLSLRTRLTFELTVGVALLITALSARTRVRLLERAYLLFGAVLMIGSALMTQVPDRHER